MNLNLSALPPPFFYCSCISLIRRWLNRVLLECELWFGPSLCFHNNQDLWLPLKNYIIRLLPYEGSNIRPQESISYMNTTSTRTNFEGNLGVKEIWWGLVKGERDHDVRHRWERKGNVSKQTETYDVWKEQE